MFALPTTTWLVIVGVLGFWIIYTGVFFVMTRNWTVEDADYDKTEGTK